MDGIETLKQWVMDSDNIVFFGGAGVSTESGIPDFRSVDGLYNQKYDYPPETILSHSFYSVHRNYCQSCGKLFDAEYILKSSGIPTCDECGGSIKPDVVLYEEGLDQQTLEDAVYYISHADMLIIGGTSLAVYPAAGLIDYYRGNKLVLINKSTTPLDSRADLLIQGSIGAVLSEV